MRLVRCILGFLLAAGGFFALLTVFAWLVRPDVSQKPTPRDPAEIAAAEKLRAADLDYENPLVLHK